MADHTEDVPAAGPAWDPNTYLTLAEAGEIAGLKPSTIHGAILRGRIPERWIGKMRVVRRDELDEYLRTRRPRANKERLRELRKIHGKRRKPVRRLQRPAGPEQRLASLWDR